MYTLPDQEISKEFAKCWHAAALHINGCAGGEFKSWLRINLNPPMLEHLSFRLGNELFYVRVEDTDAIVEGPSSRDALLTIADGCNGQACLMPMRFRNDKWEAALPGWGLEDLRTKRLLHPPAFISDVPIEMTNWELHDFAVQVVRNHITELGHELIGAPGDPSVEPAIWFEGKNGPEWVIVKAVRYPMTKAERPANIKDIVAAVSRVSTKGHFASVSVANANDSFDPKGVGALPLIRGGPLHVRFLGLELLSIE